MEVTIKRVETKSDLKKFIYLPAEIHKDHKTWLPPIYKDEWNFYNPEKNKAFSHSDTILYLAYRGDKIAGRIMGIINKLYNELHNEKNGRFFALETYDDNEVVHSLITAVEEWARQKGMEKLVGPLGFSDKDPQGAQIEGFNYQTIIATVGNFEYLPRLIEQQGYSKKVDLHDYLITIPKEFPPIYKKVYDRIISRNDFRFEMPNFTRKSELKKYIVPVFRLMNELYAHIYGFVPLEEEEMFMLADEYLPILKPEFVKAVLVEGEIAAFVIAMPEISEGIKKSKGHLFPFGFIHLLRSMNKAKGMMLLLGGVKHEYRYNGLDVLLGINLMRAASKHGMKTIESHLILETNKVMIGEVLKVGGKLIKKFRIFQKDL